MPPAKDTLYFDGACGLCQRSTRILRALDWLGRLEFQDFTQMPEDELPVSFETAMQGLPMQTSSGEILVGYPAMRRGLRRTPLGFVPALIMYIPGISHIGRRVYRTVASRRSRSLSCSISDRAAVS